jgi:carboxylesterase type B
VTLAGESAGAVYCHAHMVMKVPMRQFILSSGSLYLSPPQPQEKAKALRNMVKEKLREFSDLPLKHSPVPELIEAVKRSGIQSCCLQADHQLQNWHQNTGIAQRLLVSDMTNEVCLCLVQYSYMLLRKG